MASQGAKSTASILLILNLFLYLVVIVVASWAINHESVSILTSQARIFPMYFPIGNMATGFFVILSLLASVVGLTTSLTGLHNVFLWNGPNLHAASASSLATWALTLLAMGLACKEIELGWTHSNLRTLEIITIIVSVTQMLSFLSIQSGVEEVIVNEKFRAGRV